MDWLITLLAFAGVMAFLSTLLSVFIEGLHKAFGMRRAGLEEMLRALHARVLTRLDPATAQLDTSEFLPEGDHATGDRFARRMTDNISFRGRGWFGWMRQIPIMREFVERRHERLSTLQFVEQLARTDVAHSLRAMSRPQRQRALTAAAYEFERFGDSQSTYFQSRARVLSVVFALIFALAANIDALQIYKRLRADAELRAIFSNEQAIDQYERERATAPAEGTTSQQALSDLVTRLDQAQSQGLPVGYMMYPHCQNSPAMPAVQFDARCGLPGVRSQPTTDLDVLQSLSNFWFSTAGWLWMLSVLLAGGLIGLGAPFWYQLFRRLARIVPAAQSVRAVMQPETAPTPSPATHREAVRDANAATPNALLLAFDVASGTVADSVAGADSSRAPMIVRGDGSLAAPRVTRHLR